MPSIKNILVVRNDKIGDFVLALPAIQAIKQAFPAAQVTALVPNYTKAIAEQFQWIDDVIIDPKDPAQKSNLAKQLKAHNFDACLCLFSDQYNATLVRRANIPVRVAPGTKWVQFLYTHRLRQRRSQSLKAEFEYNLDLANFFIDLLKGQPVPTSEKMFHYPLASLEQQKSKLKAAGVLSERKTCFIHPVTGGSSNTLDQQQWVDLAVYLASRADWHFVITAGPGESEQSQKLVTALKDKVEHVSLYDKNDGLADFMLSIGLADLFIAGSTGPLHIAGALDVPTIGFYPRKRSSTPVRWKTLNSPGRWLPFTPTEQEDVLSQLQVSRRFDDIGNWLESLQEQA
ncbi:glycosyltransferase family 9 protein [Marinomonas epiphytica]